MDPPGQLKQVHELLVPGPRLPPPLPSSDLNASVAILAESGDWFEFANSALLSSDIPTGCISAQLAADLGLTRVRAQPKGFWTPRGRVESEWYAPVWCQVKAWDLPPLLIVLPILDQANALPMGTTIGFGKDFIEHCFGEPWSGMPHWP
jgi:hypothetical protein